MYPYDDNNSPTTGYYSYCQPAPPPQEQRPRKRRGRTAALACACLLVSAAAGFGGGLLAVSNFAPANAAAAVVPEASPSGAGSSAANSAEPLNAPSSGSSGAMSVSEVVSSVSDSVVAIETTVKTTYFRQELSQTGAGSGVIISEDGLIVTNNHVIEGTDEIVVRLHNNESYPAVLVGSDTQTDVAVIRIEAEGLSAAVIGSSASLSVGDETIAIGNPLGELGGTVTNGIISALNREVTIEDETMTLIQTNAAINPGNSGGGLFNNRGELIGIVVAKSSGTGVEGLGFAIPIDTARAVAEDLVEHGYVTGRGELGVSILEISDQRTAFYYRVSRLGVYIAEVQTGSAAEAAGLKIGDCVLAVDGEEISTAAALQNRIGSRSAGDVVELTVLRDNAQQTIPVTLQESIPESAQQRPL